MEHPDALLHQSEDANSCGGERPTFAQFFKREWPKLRSHLSRFVGQDEAEDIAQEAFTRIYAAQSELYSPGPLLYKTARRILIDRSRSRGRSLEQVSPPGLSENISDGSASPEEQVDQRDRLGRAAQMLEHMPAKLREVFLLQVMDGYSYAEIAGQLNLSVKCVKNRLLRAFEICAKHSAKEERHAGRRFVRTRRQPVKKGA